MAFGRGMPSTQVAGDLARRSELFTRHTNAHLDGIILGRTVLNQHPDAVERSFILNTQRDKERVSQESIKRTSMQREPIANVPKAGIMFHPFPGKRRPR